MNNKGMIFQDNPSHTENQGTQILCKSIVMVSLQLYLNFYFLYVIVDALIKPAHLVSYPPSLMSVSCSMTVIRVFCLKGNE